MQSGHAQEVAARRYVELRSPNLPYSSTILYMGSFQIVMAILGPSRTRRGWLTEPAKPDRVRWKPGRGPSLTRRREVRAVTRP